MKRKNQKRKFNIPRFKNEDEERTYWAKINLSQHFNSSDFERVSFPNLKPTSRPISLRIPEYLIVRIKEQANEMSVPYQSLMKRYLAEGALKK